MAAARTKQAEPKLEDLFIEAAPKKPAAPRKPWMLSLAEGTRKVGPFVGPLVGGTLGALAGLQTGGAGIALGIGAGIAAIPVTGALGALGGILVGDGVERLTDNDTAAIVTGLGVFGIGALAAPVAGYFIGSAASGTWWAIGTAVASGLGGLAIGWGVPALVLDGSNMDWEYEQQVSQHKGKVEQYEKDYTDWKKRRAEVIFEGQEKANLSIEKDEEKVVVGGITLGRKPRKN